VGETLTQHLAFYCVTMAQFGSPEEWFRSLPPLTKGILVAAVSTTVLTSIGIVSPASLYLDLYLIISKFQIWRLITPFIFFGPFGFKFVFAMFIFVQYSPRYEADPFSTGGNNSADYAFMLCLGIGVLSVSGFCGEIPLPSERSNPEMNINFRIRRSLDIFCLCLSYHRHSCSWSCTHGAEGTHSNLSLSSDSSLQQCTCRGS